MTSMTRGPLPASVYWRRRAVAVGLALTLLLMIVNAVRGSGHADPTAAQARQVSALTSSTPTGTTTTDPTASKAHRKARGSGTGVTSKVRDQVEPTTPATPQGPTQPILAPPTGACSDSDVMVTPTVGAATAGQAVQITLALRTRTAAACTWHVSASHLAVKVSRFGNEVWSSRLCPQQVPITDVVVRQAVASTLRLAWSSRRAVTGCPRMTPYAQRGHYVVAAAAVGGLPAQSGFDLVPATVVKTTPTQTPTKAPTQAPAQAPTQTPTKVPTQTPTQGPTQAGAPATR